MNGAQMLATQTAEGDRPAVNGGHRAHVIVFGNEKGGSGKSTSAMHVAVALLRLGYAVGTIDLDARQGTLTRTLRNRWRFAARNPEATPMPLHMAIPLSGQEARAEAYAEEDTFLDMALAELGAQCDFIVVDTPGSDTNLGRRAHACADTLITPLNDSLVDLDVLADIDPDTQEILGESVYSRMVADHKKPECRWIVMRNRLSHIDAANKRTVGDLVELVGARLGFSTAPGFGERVIFRELFLKGLTLLDIRQDSDARLSMSTLTARQEVRHLVHAIAPERFHPLPRPPKDFSKTGESG